MQQLAIFAPPARPIVVPQGDPDGLRPYQRTCFDAIQEAHKVQRSTGIEVPTGGGKTRIFSVLAKHEPGRTLIITPLRELTRQARNEAERRTGHTVSVEQADWYAHDSRIVVASIQTISQQRRLERFKPDDFSLIIVDEAHLSYGEGVSYKRVLDYFAVAKILGVTATWDRADKKHHGAIYESICYRISIDELIDLGFLCPYRVTRIHVDSINLDAVRTKNGDLHVSDLDAILSVEANLHAIATGCLEQTGDRKTIVFSGPKVSTSQRLVEVFNRYRPGCAREVNGETDAMLRIHTQAAHMRGEFQFLVNVGVYTLGYDCPPISCVAFARMTKSRALYTQMAGRGLRIFPGKEDCLLLDFVANSSRHELVSALDLSTGYDEATKRRAAKKIDKAPGMKARDALEQSKKEIDAEAQAAAAKRAAVKAKVKYRVESVDPFAMLGVKQLPGEKPPWAPASARDVEILTRNGMKGPVEGWSADVAKQLCRTIESRRRFGLASPKQVKSLAKVGVDAVNMRGVNAGRLMAALFAKKNAGGRWGFEVGEVAQILNTVQEPGYDG